MKKIVINIMILLAICQCCSAQSVGQQVTDRISQKMKDSLWLNTTEFSKIDSLNQLLYTRKMELRQQYGQPDSLTIYTQRVEKSRDSLYRLFLSVEKYQLYKQKKRNLISNN